MEKRNGFVTVGAGTLCGVGEPRTPENVARIFRVRSNGEAYALAPFVPSGDFNHVLYIGSDAPKENPNG